MAKGRRASHRPPTIPLGRQFEIAGLDGKRPAVWSAGSYIYLVLRSMLACSPMVKISSYTQVGKACVDHAPWGSNSRPPPSCRDQLRTPCDLGVVLYCGISKKAMVPYRR